MEIDSDKKSARLSKVSQWPFGVSEMQRVAVRPYQVHNCTLAIKSTENVEN